MMGRPGRVPGQVGRAVLRWRTLRGVRVRVLALDLLAVTLEAMGWRCVRLYRLEVGPVPVLWVHGGGDADAGLAVTVLASRGGWYYADAGNLRERFLGLCSDRAGAAAAVDARLKWQLTAVPDRDASGSDGPGVTGGCAR
ncbi:hypothetical protein [Actinomadura formosensis]|uniref:hypothetical protein n=1 Tax=Actinomadura formosensis TaxID=60706 RepID=UPI003D92C1B3